MGILDNLFRRTEVKKVPAIARIDEHTRDGIQKAYIPKFLYKPPFGYPRFEDLPMYRRLSASPFVDMCTSTIIDEACAIEWDIISEEGEGTNQKQVEQVKNFFLNPNTNKESFDEIRRKYLRDILEIDAGVINKIYNLKGEMVEIVARDGSTFTKNPDLFGMLTNREDIIIEPNIAMTNREAEAMEPGWINAEEVREKAAYFQYGWITGARPVPFGKKEIVWFERNPRTDSIYGRSPVSVLAETIQTLIYAVEHNLEYFNNNSIPYGVLGLDGSNTDEIKAFKDQWKEQQRTKDAAGNWKRHAHSLPIVNHTPTYTRFGFTNSELELLEGQKWWAKLVWACFGVTSTELGFTEEAKGMSNQIVQSNVFKKRALYPLLKLEEYKINTEILPEFGYPNIKFKFKMFDVDEEMKKAQLYQMQINSGLMTVNEVRHKEGLDPVEWGDQDPKRGQETSFNFGSEKEEKPKKEEKEEKADSVPQPVQKAFGDHDTLEACMKANEGERDPYAYCCAVHKKNTGVYPEEKSLSPLLMQEGEEMNYQKLKKSITYLLSKNEQELLNLIEKEYGRNTIKEIKSVDDIAKSIKKILIFEGMKAITDQVIKNTFLKGWDEAEKQMNRNFPLNNEAVRYIQSYAFNNIVDLTEEIKNDLRAELERGIMAGEGVSNLKARVKKVFDVGEDRAEMIARTETNRAQNQGKLLAFKTSGENYKKKWVSAKDERTSELCMHLNGQVVDLNEDFIDKKTGWKGPAPPAHVNCRSAMIFITEDEEKEEKKSAEKILSEELDIKMKEKELQIKERKESLLKKLEDDLNGRNKNLSNTGQTEPSTQ